MRSVLKECAQHVEILEEMKQQKESEMSSGVCCSGMLGFLFLELMKVVLLRDPRSNRLKHRDHLMV